MNNVVIVSGGEQRDSAIHIQISILPQTPVPSRAVAGSFDLHPVIFWGAALGCCCGSRVYHCSGFSAYRAQARSPQVQELQHLVSTA